MHVTSQGDESHSKFEVPVSTKSIRQCHHQAGHCKSRAISLLHPLLWGWFCYGGVIRDPSRQGTGGLGCLSVPYSDVTWMLTGTNPAPDPERLSQQTRLAAQGYLIALSLSGDLWSFQQIQHTVSSPTRECLDISISLHLSSLFFIVWVHLQNPDRH